MRSFILTFLILSNIVGGIEVASDIEDLWSDFGALSSAYTETPSLSGDGPDPLDTKDCDHCCHSGAHFAGFVLSVVEQPFERQTQLMPIVHSFYHLASGAPPTPPPNA